MMLAFVAQGHNIDQLRLSLRIFSHTGEYLLCRLYLHQPFDRPVDGFVHPIRTAQFQFHQVRVHDCSELGRPLQLNVRVCVAFSINDGAAKARRWQIRKLKYKKTDLVLVVRMDSSNAKIQDYYWFPTVHLALSNDKKRRLTARTFPEMYRHDNLDSFYRAYARIAPTRKST
jgi:hypothetical protein